MLSLLFGLPLTFIHKIRNNIAFFLCILLLQESLAVTTTIMLLLGSLLSFSLDSSPTRRSSPIINYRQVCTPSVGLLGSKRSRGRLGPPTLNLSLSLTTVVCSWIMATVQGVVIIGFAPGLLGSLGHAGRLDFLRELRLMLWLQLISFWIFTTVVQVVRVPCLEVILSLALLVFYFLLCLCGFGLFSLT